MKAGKAGRMGKWYYLVVLFGTTLFPLPLQCPNIVTAGLEPGRWLQFIVIASLTWVMFCIVYFLDSRLTVLQERYPNVVWEREKKRTLFD